MKNCFIVGAGKCSSVYIPDSISKYVIAADGGFEKLKIHGIEPDLVLGDFDSSAFVPQFENILTFPCEKDETDTAIALKKALEKGCERIFIYGGTGGREDHTFANIQLLSFAALNNANAYLLYDDMIATVIKNSSILFEKDEKGYISVFSLSEASDSVTIKGLKYTAEDVTLSNMVALGVSNEFTGEPAEISVKNGSLLVMWQTDIKKAIDKLVIKE